MSLLLCPSAAQSIDTDQRYLEASIQTADNLRTVALAPEMRDLSRLSLPEVATVVDLVARTVPAGNVPAIILSGLARLSGKKPSPQTIKRDINLLFKGVEKTLDKAVYGAFFAGPAAIIWGYQNLLKLAGQDPEDSFPEGIWQFYVEYALRDDTARHANETHGFDTALSQRQIQLSAADRITAWVMAAIYGLHQYNALIANEWHERVSINLLRQLTQHSPDAARYARLFRAWELQRPYRIGPDAAPGYTFPAYRREKFDGFLESALRESTPVRDLPDDLRRQWREQLQATADRDIPAYLQQMSILAYLDPGAYGETRTPYSITQAHIGLIYQGHYYLIPVCAPDTGRPTDVSLVREQIARLIHDPPDSPPSHLMRLAEIKRSAWAAKGVRDKLSQTLAADLEALRYAPILLNCDPRPRQVALSELRQAERGVGDHALTILDAGSTFVFDQSHIFFDGVWGAALAEILTNDAVNWAAFLGTRPPVQPGPARPRSLACQFQASDLELIQPLPRVAVEVGAENATINLKELQTLRQLFKQRNDLIRLTVNDLLVLYRAIHAATFQPDPALVAELNALAHASRHAARLAAQAALEAIGYASRGRDNPAILIPVDSSQRSPRDRLYPVTFEVPLEELDLLNLHRQVMAALAACQATGQADNTTRAEFDRLQRIYLATLAGFGEVMSRVKAMTITGQSASAGTLKLLAHLPTPLQRLLDQVPGRFDVLNELIKGREVLSNVGAVAPSSTLTRFITAKDDNVKKTLAWGVLTDASGTLRITLRDFRRHVGLLDAVGQRELATRIAQDYVDAYARGLNNYVADLLHITRESTLAPASRKTRLKQEPVHE